MVKIGVPGYSAHLGTESARESKLLELRYCKVAERIFLTVGIAKWPVRLRLQVFCKKTLTRAQIPMQFFVRQRGEWFMLV